MILSDICYTTLHPVIKHRHSSPASNTSGQNVNDQEEIELEKHSNCWNYGTFIMIHITKYIKSGALVPRALYKSNNWSSFSKRLFVSEWLNAFRLFKDGTLRLYIGILVVVNKIWRKLNLFFFVPNKYQIKASVWFIIYFRWVCLWAYNVCY